MKMEIYYGKKNGKTENWLGNKMDYKQLLILRLSNLTEWKSEAEMIIPEEMRRDFDWAKTCEFLGDGKYILRRYWEHGHPSWKEEYQNGQKHGLSFGWYENGHPYRKKEYQNGQLHGLSVWYYENGHPECKTEFQNGQLHGLSVWYYENGHPECKIEYQNGLRHGKCVELSSDGTIYRETEYRKGQEIR